MRNSDIQRHRDQGRSLTQRSGEQGNWRGYYQPYEYYGPGYRGVGYYAVFYQGPGTSGAADQGDVDEPETQFDQRNVQYGQGQSAGAAWDDRRRSSWGRSESGAWRDRARQFGQFAGRGPKGYQRSDERIREEISDRLMEHPEIDASDLEVKVKNGVVTLSGTVDDRSDKRLAEDIAESVMGVSDVMNQLGVQSQTGESSGKTFREGTAEATTTSGSPRNGRRATATSSR